MLSLRAKTGCQLFFFVEGPAFPSPQRAFGRATYKSIVAAETSLMLRDGVHVVKTRDQGHTAQRLLCFVKALRGIATPFCGDTIPAARAQLLPAPADEKSGGSAGAHPPELEPEPLAAPPLRCPSAVKGAVPRSDEELCTGIWSRLRGVAGMTSKVLARSFSVDDLVSERVDMQDVSALRTASGRPLGKSAVDSLCALRRGSKIHEAKVLSGVPGVGAAMAAQVLDGRSLRTLLSWDVGAVADVAIQTKSRTVRLGKVRAERVLRLLHLRLELGHVGGEGADRLRGDVSAEPDAPH